MSCEDVKIVNFLAESRASTPTEEKTKWLRSVACQLLLNFLVTLFQESTETKTEASSVETDSSAKIEPALPVEQPKVNVWDARKKERDNQVAEKTSAPATGNFNGDI